MQFAGLAQLANITQPNAGAAGALDQDDQSADLLFLFLEDEGATQLAASDRRDSFGSIGDNVASPGSSQGFPNVLDPFPLAEDEAHEAHASTCTDQQLEQIDQLLQALNGHPGFQNAVLLVILLGLSSTAGGLLPAAGGSKLEVSCICRWLYCGWLWDGS